MSFRSQPLRLLRNLVPRVTAPILPTTLRTTSALTRSARPVQKRLFQNFTARLAKSTSSDDIPPHSLPEDATISQKLKHLIKSYGWYALGVYLVFSALDFGVAFAAINLLGAEQVSAVAATVKTSLYGAFNSKPPEPGKEEIETASGSGHEGLYAMLVLAYTIHKTLFLPFRVGLTAAFTPRLVGWLRVRGWAGGAGTRRAAEVCTPFC